MPPEDPLRASPCGQQLQCARCTNPCSLARAAAGALLYFYFHFYTNLQTGQDFGAVAVEQHTGELAMLQRGLYFLM